MLVGGDAYKVPRYVWRVAVVVLLLAIAEPVKRGAGVEHGFKRGETFAGDDKEGVLALHLLQNLLQIVGIDVADKMQALVGQGVVVEGLHGHARPQV